MSNNLFNVIDLLEKQLRIIEHVLLAKNKTSVSKEEIKLVESASSEAVKITNDILKTYTTIPEKAKKRTSYCKRFIGNNKFEHKKYDTSVS